MMGATGKFPQGQLNAHDEGELRLGMTARGNKVIVYFGKPVAWMGMDARQAREVAASLIKWAMVAEAAESQPYVVTAAAAKWD
jgi:hypothetical protein